MNNPIENLKSAKSRTSELVITTVLIAAGVNLVIFGVCTLLVETHIYFLLIIGLALIFSSVFFMLYRSFVQSNRKEIINAVVFYDKYEKSVIKVENYDFSEELYKCLIAAMSEDSNIKGMWLQDELGLTNVFNNIDSEKTYIGLSRSAALLNHLIEYLLLKKLSLLTTDYFNTRTLDKRKVKIISRTDVAELISTNCFLNLFSKPTYERTAFNNKSTQMVYGYGKNGAIYDKFEVYLPENCTLSRGELNTIIIKHRYFKLIITPAFSGFGQVIPSSFIKKYMKISDIHNISTFKVFIGIELKFSWNSFFMKKTEYFKWIDNFIDSVKEFASFQMFFDKIQWNIVEAILSSERN